MFPIILFVILGINTNANAIYWIVFAVYCVCFLLDPIRRAAAEL